MKMRDKKHKMLKLCVVYLLLWLLCLAVGQAAAEEEFYIYDDDFANIDDIQYWNGDIGFEHVQEDGNIVIKNTFNNASWRAWATFHEEPGLDLSGYDTLKFSAKTPDGNRRIKCGVIDYRKSNNEKFDWFEVTTSWQEFSLDVSELDMEHIKHGFYVVTDPNQNPPDTLFVDAVRFVRPTPPLSVDAGEDKTIHQKQSVQLITTVSGGVPPYTYQWTPIEGLDDPTAENPVASPASTTTYSLTVTDSVGNTATDSVNVFLNGKEQAADYYVDANKGSNTAGDGTQAKPWKTITYALSQVSEDGHKHTIYVASATYDTALGESFPIVMKNGVSLVGEGADSTILDAEETATVVHCVGITDSTTRLQGFTIKNGYVNSATAAGIFISEGATLTIAHNFITANFSKWWGSDPGGASGIGIHSASPKVTHNTISKNEANCGSAGGILVIGDSKPEISYNIISDNSSYTNDSAGGILIASASPVIIGNTIRANSGYPAPGILVYGDGESVIANNVIIGHRVESTAGPEGTIQCEGVGTKTRIFNNNILDNPQGGIYLSSSSPFVSSNIIAFNGGFGISVGGGSPSIRYNLFWGNTEGICRQMGTGYSSIVDMEKNVFGSIGNIEAEPLFVDAAKGDYHLLAESPAIDAGDPDLDYSKEPAPNCWVDIGAYGNTPEAPPSPFGLAKAQISATQHDFGEVPKYSEADWSFSVSNVSAQKLWVTVISNNRYFEVRPTSKQIISAGSSQSFQVRFASWVEGPHACSLDVTTNDPEQPTARITMTAVVTSDIPAGATYYVDSKGNNTTGDGSQAKPWQSISYALGQIAGKATIMVAEGVYDTEIETFPILVKNGISLIGAGAGKTVLDAKQTGSVIKGIGITDRGTRIEGFTIKSGHAEKGGGIFISAGSILVLKDNTISDNYATYEGGGIYISNSSSPMIQNNKITGNSAGSQSVYSFIRGYGGGIYISNSSSPRITDNIISENTVGAGAGNSGLGGGIYISESSSPIITNNTISENWLIQRAATANYTRGGGIYIEDSSPIITGNRISRNTATADYGTVSECSGIYVSGSSPTVANNVITDNDFGGIFLLSSSPVIINNTITGNEENGISLGVSHSFWGDASDEKSTPSITNNIISHNTGYGIYEATTENDSISVTYNLFYRNEEGAYYDEGKDVYYSVADIDSIIAECSNNLQGDPLFVDVVNGDYHLRGYSPGVDTGDSSSDYRNEPEPNGSRINIGAYGNTTEAAIWSPSAALRPDYYVDDDGSNETGDGTISNPWKTITHALAQILPPAEDDLVVVHVAEGTYDVTLGEVFPLLVKNRVSLIGKGADVTVLDSGGTASVVKCVGITETTTSIEGFTIKNGHAEKGGGIFISAGSSPVIENNVISDNSVGLAAMFGRYTGGFGGGIYISGSSSPKIINNTIVDNDASGGIWGYAEGGGIYINDSSSPVIKGNTIKRNRAQISAHSSTYGGGICIREASPTITNNLIVENNVNKLGATALGTYGSAIYVENSSEAVIAHNTISNNTATADWGTPSDRGGGIYIITSSPTISRNVIANNDFGGIHLESSSSLIVNNTIVGNDDDGIYLESSSSPSIVNNIVAYNKRYGICEEGTKDDPSSVRYNLFYYNEEGIYHDEGQSSYYTVTDMDSHILECSNNLVGDPLFRDMVKDDYHLRSANSPAVDTGEPNTQYNDLDGTRADIGVFFFNQKEIPPPDTGVDVNLFEVVLNKGINMISVPLAKAVVKVDDGEFSENPIRNISDLFEALEGSTTLIIYYNTELEKFHSYTENTKKGTPVDIEIKGDTGLIINMTEAKSITFKGEAWPGTVDLVSGINLIGLPVDAGLTKLSDLAGELGDNAKQIISFNPEAGKFSAYTEKAPETNIDITGDLGLILIVGEAQSLTLTGDPWSNPPEEAAPTAAIVSSIAPVATSVLVVDGTLIHEVTGTKLNEISVTVRNLSTGVTLTDTTTSNTSDGRFSATFVNINGYVAKVGDVLEFNVVPQRGSFKVEQIRYRLTATDMASSRVALGNLIANVIPLRDELLCNFPNPFNPDTWIPYKLAHSSKVTIRIYNVTGQLIRQLKLGHKDAGIYLSKERAAYWDGRNDTGEHVANGAYFYQLQAGKFTATKKLVVLK